MTASQDGPPPQSQDYPGRTGEMTPQPRDEMRCYQGRRQFGELATQGDAEHAVLRLFTG